MSPLSEDGRPPASAEVSREGYLLEEMMHLRGPRLAGWAHWQGEKRGRYERGVGGGGDEVGTWEMFKMRKRNGLKKDLRNGTGERVSADEGVEPGRRQSWIWIPRSQLFSRRVALLEKERSWTEAPGTGGKLQPFFCGYGQNHYA